jgi:hypothetical protein
VLSIFIKKRVSNYALREEKYKCTDLVVWGTNLGSTVGSGRFTKQVSEMVKLPLFYRSVIVGLILSDAGLSFYNKTAKNALLRLTQSLDNSRYFYFVFFILSHYCSSYPYYRARYRFGKTNFYRELFYRTLPCFTELYSLFYLNGIKIIPHNIYDLLTPVAIAHWRFIYINIYKLKYIIYIFHLGPPSKENLGEGTARGSGLMLGTD